jgi:hypothetical protein
VSPYCECNVCFERNQWKIHSIIIEFLEAEATTFKLESKRISSSITATQQHRTRHPQSCNSTQDQNEIIFTTYKTTTELYGHTFIHRLDNCIPAYRFSLPLLATHIPNNTLHAI